MDAADFVTTPDRGRGRLPLRFRLNWRKVPSARRCRPRRAYIGDLRAYPRGRTGWPWQSVVPMSGNTPTELSDTGRWARAAPRHQDAGAFDGAVIAGGTLRASPS